MNGSLATNSCERFDIDLIEKVAKAKPEWQFILIGPVVKIDPATLPQLSNIHYLGGKDYKQLPAYVAGWDIAMVPFAFLICVGILYINALNIC